MTQADVSETGPSKPERDPNFTTYMEQLQEGYVSSVAATAGCGFNKVSRDNYGMDALLVRAPLLAKDEEVSVYAQLKNTTTIKPDPTKDSFRYQFKKREYWDHLAKIRRWPKAILIVMVTHPTQSLWTSGDHESLKVVHCCYWQSLEGMTIADEVKYPSVHIPLSNIFDATALTSILDRLDRGEAIRG